MRPCTLQIYFDGFAEKHYCPRMATMNKPVYNNTLRTLYEDNFAFYLSKDSFSINELLFEMNTEEYFNLSAFFYSFSSFFKYNSKLEY